MKFFFSLYLLLTCITSNAQVPLSGSSVKMNQDMPSIYSERRSVEICNNNIDDDDNGLTDMKDPACYFSATSDTCTPTRILWATFRYKLYRVDLDTHQDRMLNFAFGEAYDDITWAPNGKLYGAEMFSNTIREIDPNTATSVVVGVVTGHYYTNGLTSDAASNLYTTSKTTASGGRWRVVKYNPATGSSLIIADLTTSGLESGGDIAFLNGFLYVTCVGEKLAKVNPSTGSVQVITVTGTGPTTGLGLISLGDGFLYYSSSDVLYKIDPLTWVSTYYYTWPSYGYTFGMSAYSESCNAPGCRPKVNININRNPPFCSNTGVLLKAAGTGIYNAQEYTWMKPGGQAISGDTLRAFAPGRYYVNYHSLSDSCYAIDSIDVAITQFPSLVLGIDTIICGAAPVLLQPFVSTGITSYLWEDGSSNPQHSVTVPGIAWLEVSNACGTIRDSINVLPRSLPVVNVGQNVLLCPRTSAVLKNSAIKKNGENYKWSTGSTEDSITVTHTGTFWLESSNPCGSIRDSVFVIMKDSCVCNPFYALADLGKDVELCRNEMFLLSNIRDRPGFRYRWQDGSTNNTFKAIGPGRYHVDVTTYCGTVRDTIFIKEKITDCECLTYLPNAFTPNEDGTNDAFSPSSNCIMSGNMKIYNRWGNLIYSSDDLAKGWDGYYKGLRQSPGSYVYYLSYKYQNSILVYNKRGSFLLIR